MRTDIVKKNNAHEKNVHAYWDMYIPSSYIAVPL